MKKKIRIRSDEEIFAYLRDVIEECDEALKVNPADKKKLELRSTCNAMFTAINLPFVGKKACLALSESIERDHWQYEPEGKHKKYLEEPGKKGEGEQL